MIETVESTLAMPEAVEGKMIPTLNGFGYMTANLDSISEQFAVESQHAEGPVLEIGAAYGNVVLSCLRRGAEVSANDIDPRHLEILRARACEEGLEKRLSLQPGKFPADVLLPAAHYAMALACRVFHFFDGEAIEKAFAALHRSLRQGGRLFVVLDTPYNNYFSGMIPPFQQRKAKGALWPGLFVGEELPKYIPGYNLERSPGVYNLFDLETLERAIKDAGFELVSAGYIARPDYLKEGQMDGRECVGAIARKP